MSGSIYENSYIKNLPRYALPTAALIAVGGFTDSQKDSMGEKQFFVRAGRPENGTFIMHGIVPGMPESAATGNCTAILSSLGKGLKDQDSAMRVMSGVSDREFFEIYSKLYEERYTANDKALRDDWPRIAENFEELDREMLADREYSAYRRTSPDSLKDFLATGEAVYLSDKKKDLTNQEKI